MVAAYEHRPLAVKLRVELFQIGDFWQVVVRDVGAFWMQRGIVLMIGFGGIKSPQPFHLGHDIVREGTSLVEFRDIGLGGALLARSARCALPTSSTLLTTSHCKILA
jgi:hypothetical protein